MASSRYQTSCSASRIAQSILGEHCWFDRFQRWPRPEAWPWLPGNQTCPRRCRAVQIIRALEALALPFHKADLSSRMPVTTENNKSRIGTCAIFTYWRNYSLLPCGLSRKVWTPKRLTLETQKEPRPAKTTPTIPLRKVANWNRGSVPNAVLAVLNGSNPLHATLDVPRAAILDETLFPRQSFSGMAMMVLGLLSFCSNIVEFLYRPTRSHHDEPLFCAA